MTAQQISNIIQKALEDGFEHRTNKQKVYEAIESIIPLLGHIPTLKRIAEYNYAVACSEGVENSKGAERIRLKLAEGFAANEKAALEEVRTLESSLRSALSGLQSLLKEYD